MNKLVLTFSVCILVLIDYGNAKTKIVKSGIPLNYTRSKDVLPGIFERSLLSTLNEEMISGANENDKSDDRENEKEIGNKELIKNSKRTQENTKNDYLLDNDKNKTEAPTTNYNKTQKVESSNNLPKINETTGKIAKDNDEEGKIKRENSKVKLPENLRIRVFKNDENSRKLPIKEIPEYVIPYNGNNSSKITNNKIIKKGNHTEKLPGDKSNVTVIVISSENDEAFPQMPKEIRKIRNYLSKISNENQIKSPNDDELPGKVLGFEGNVVKSRNHNQTETMNDIKKMPINVTPDEGLLTRLRRLFSTITGNAIKLPVYYEGNLTLRNNKTGNNLSKLPMTGNTSRIDGNKNDTLIWMSKLPEISNLTELNQFLNPAYYQDYDYYTSQCLAYDWATPTECQYDTDCCSLSCCESNLCTPFFLSVPCKVSKAINSIP